MYLRNKNAEREQLLAQGPLWYLLQQYPISQQEPVEEPPPVQQQSLQQLHQKLLKQRADSSKLVLPAIPSPRANEEEKSKHTSHQASPSVPLSVVTTPSLTPPSTARSRIIDSSSTSKASTTPTSPKTSQSANSLPSLLRPKPVLSSHYSTNDIATPRAVPPLSPLKPLTGVNVPSPLASIEELEDVTAGLTTLLDSLQGDEKRLYDKHEIYRQCFWPFHVWRRWVVRRRSARAKAIFLLRVFQAAQLMRIIRRWVLYTKDCSAVTSRFSKVRKQHTSRRLRTSFQCWTDFVAKQRVIHSMLEHSCAVRLRYNMSRGKLAVLLLLKWHAIWAREVRRRRSQIHLARNPEYALTPLTPCLAEHDNNPLTALYKFFVKKDINSRIAMRLLFRRNAVRFMKLLKENCIYSKKTRFAIARGNRIILRNHLVVWHEYVVENSERKKINAVEKDPKERVAEIMKLAKAKAQLEAEKRQQELALRAKQAAQGRALALLLERKRKELQHVLADKGVKTNTSSTQEMKREKEVLSFLKAAERGHKEALKEEMREYKHRVNKVRALIVSDMRDRAVERAEHQAKANVFRVLMKPVLLKRALLFNARREMRSMIRSVFIVRSMLQQVVACSRLYLMWRAWVGWRTFVLEARRWQTPGLSREIIRRKSLMFARVLAVEKGMRFNTYDTREMFMRWMEYTQQSARMKRLIAVVNERNKWRIAKRAFMALKLSTNFREKPFRPPPAPEKRRVAPPDPIEERLTDTLLQWRDVLYREFYFRRERMYERQRRQKMGDIGLLAQGGYRRFEHTGFLIRKRIALEARLLTVHLHTAGHTSTHINAVLKLRRAELLYHFDSCVAFAQKLRTEFFFEKSLAPLTTLRISSGIANWLFSVRSYGLVRLPVIPTTPKKSKSKSSKIPSKPPPTFHSLLYKKQLPKTTYFKKHIKFLNKFVYTKRQHETMAGIYKEKGKKGDVSTPTSMMTPKTDLSRPSTSASTPSSHNDD